LTTLCKTHPTSVSVGCAPGANERGLCALKRHTLPVDADATPVKPSSAFGAAVARACLAVFAATWALGCVDVKRPPAFTTDGSRDGVSRDGVFADAPAEAGGGSPADASRDAEPSMDTGADAPDVNASKLTKGEACGSSAACETGHCVDGVCCATACAGACWTCAAEGFAGTCRAATPGTDPRNACIAETPSSCGQTGVCDDKQACAFHGADVECAALACRNNAAELSRCNGKGMCVVAETRPCFPYGCGAPAGCRIVCTSNSDCTAPAECFSGTCGGLLGTYFSTTDFTGPSLTRTDAQIDFLWQLNSPAPTIPIDGFSIRWTGTLRPRFSEVHTFHVVSDDGARLWVDGQLIVDDFRSRGTMEISGTVSLQANRPVTIKLEYFDDNSEATARLFWSSPNLPRQIVPVTVLTP
jgi:hypothetical protein